MKTSIFDMNFVLPPVVEMTEVVKDMPMGTHYSCSAYSGCCINCQKNSMKTSIFDMNFVLPPLVEMSEVMKDMPIGTISPCGTWDAFQETAIKTSIFDMR